LGGRLYTDAHPEYDKYSATRLALVDRSGAVQPFGPTFPSDSSIVTSVAASADGSQVAVALYGRNKPSGPVTARIELLPMPGHSGELREWTVSGDVDQVQSL
jgi:hypothetical protein